MATVLVVGGGDWLSLLEELQQMDVGTLDTILRSSDPELLADELESARFVQKALRSRIDRLSTEARVTQDELDEWQVARRTTSACLYNVANIRCAFARLCGPRLHS